MNPFPPSCQQVLGGDINVPDQDTPNISSARHPQPCRFTHKDWSEHQELISQKYIRDRMSLKAIRAFMATEHHLLATEKMYKYRFKAWNVTKFLQADEAEALIRIKAFRKAAGKPVELYRWGENITTAKLQRYLDDHPHLKAKLQQTSPRKSVIDHWTDNFLPQRGFAVVDCAIPRAFRNGDDSGLMELSIHALESFDSTHMRWSFADIPRSPWMIYYALFEFDLRDVTDNGGWQLMHRACQEMRKDISQDPDGVFLNIFSILGTGNVIIDHAALARHLVKYISELYRSSLGPRHPYSVVFQNATRLIQNESAYEGLQLSILKIMTDAFVKSVPKNIGDSTRKPTFWDLFDHVSNQMTRSTGVVNLGISEPEFSNTNRCEILAELGSMRHLHGDTHGSRLIWDRANAYSSGQQATLGDEPQLLLGALLAQTRITYKAPEFIVDTNMLKCMDGSDAISDLRLPDFGLYDCHFTHYTNHPAASYVGLSADSEWLEWLGPTETIDLDTRHGLTISSFSSGDVA